MKTIFVVDKIEIKSEDYIFLDSIENQTSSLDNVVENRINLQYHIIKLKTI